MVKSSVFRALIIDVVSKSASLEVAEMELEELINLTKTVGGVVIKKIIQKRGQPSAKTFLGTGKIEEVALEVDALDVNLIIANGVLKPTQYLHLQKLFPGKKLWDRVDLILNIFDRHAQSRLAQLQIKLARMHHEIPKIYARQATTLFERAGAGIGTRGMGEKGIEAEKRHIRQQIRQLEEKIQVLQLKQANQRVRRQRTGIPTVALVGYTNVGKSSLMQVLTKKQNVLVSDKLFATLDTKIGKMWLPEAQMEILVSDTIGFIKDLPPTLVESFLTTLEEAREADILLHVVDVSDPQYSEKIRVVESILSQIGVAKKPRIFVFNKADRLKEPLPEYVMRRYEVFAPVFTSGVTKEGVGDLRRGIWAVLGREERVENRE